MIDRDRIQIHDNLEALSRQAAEAFARLADQSIQVDGTFQVALSGGSTPRRLYQILAGAPFAGQVDWPRVQVFWVDERWVPPDHLDSNYRMVREALLDHVPIPAENVHPMPVTEGTPEDAALAYEATLAAIARSESGLTKSALFPRFHLVFLGMGEDGHTASLFPGVTAVQEKEHAVAAVWVEKLQTHRLTLTPPVLNSAASVVFLVSGSNKAETLQRVLEGPYQPDVLPSQIIQPAGRPPLWFVDRAAAERLTTR